MQPSDIRKIISLEELRRRNNRLRKEFNKNVNGFEYHSKQCMTGIEKWSALKKRKEEKQMNVLEVDIQWHMIEEDAYHKKYNEIMDKMDKLCDITKDNSYEKMIGNKKKNKLEKEVCGLCCDFHGYRDIITTNCGHLFGKSCFSKWMDHCFDSSKEITCPFCRSRRLELTRYKLCK
jgi:hypothetical protein